MLLLPFTQQFLIIFSVLLDTQWHPNDTHMPPTCHPHDSGALAKLDISSNQICGVFLEYDTWGEEKGTYDASGLEALAKAIGNLKELNISSNLIKAEGAKILAPAIQDNGALASLDISSNKLTQGKQIEGPSSSNNYQGRYKTDMSGVIALAEALKP